MEEGRRLGEELGEGDRAWGGELGRGEEEPFEGCVEGECGAEGLDLGGREKGRGEWRERVMRWVGTG